MTADPRGALWLGVGATCGLALAVYGLVRPPAVLLAPSNTRGVVATVNGTPLQRDALLGQLAGLSSEPDEERRRHVLDRMIDEELLVQRALELGLARHDRRVRADLVAAMIDSINAQADARVPDETELRAFHAENRRYFERPPRLRVQQLFVSSNRSNGAERAADLRARIQGGAPFDAIRAEADDPIAPLPDVLLPAASLREYVGASALAAVEALQPGQVAGPIAAPSGWNVLQLAERGDTAPREFSAIRAQVSAEWRRRAAERALRDYLAELRSRSAIEIAPE